MLALVLKIKIQALYWAHKDTREHFTEQDMRDEALNRYPR